MKKILPILLLFFSQPTFGHSDFITSLNRKNIHFKYITGWSQFEINQKFDILLELTDSLLSANNLNRTPIYFSFDHDYTKTDTNYSFVSIGDFEYWNSKTKNRIKHYDNGITINIRDEDFKIKEILNLIYSSLINQDYIGENSKQISIKSRYQRAQTFNSIPRDSIIKYKSNEHKAVNEVLIHKIYRKIKPTTFQRQIDYYYQNGKYHFYNTKEPDTKWNSELKKNEIVKTFGENILTVDNILEIVGSYEDGHFIFINDSTFFYIPQLKNKVIGPLTIDSLNPGRPPIIEYYSDYFNYKERRFDKFTLVIFDYIQQRKILFIPEYSVVVGNYDHLESEFITKLIDKNNNHQDSINTKREPEKYIIYIGTIIVLTLLLIFLLLKKSSNKNN